MAVDAPREQPAFVLELSVIQWGIQQLINQRTHPFFPAYLAIRRAAARQGSSTAIHPRWEDLERFLHVPGGPPNKPNYRPFWHQSSSAGQHWLNENLAGSYAPSSIREVPKKVIDLDGDGGFSLKDTHWELARKHLLFDQPMPVLPLGVFLYRDFSFTTEGPSLGPLDLVQVFREDFGYRADADDVEFDYLYDKGIPDRTDWFEPWSPPATE
ncbi:MAG: hypothetical protein U0R26_09970 [Solirubrobacterales bacterium]